MKTLVTVILLLACAGLIIALVVTQKHIDAERKKAADDILDFSNQVVAANDELNDLRQVNLALTNDLNSSRQQLTELSNQVLAVSDTLSNSDTQLKVAQDQIASLQAQNQALDQQAEELTNAIADLNAKIVDAKTQLAESETNNNFLQNELNNKVEAEKELEAKFNNLAVVRQQAKKLHNELVMERRLQWIRQGTQPNSQVKGAQLLMARSWPTNQIAPVSHYNLNVEVDSSGAVSIISDTNTPATNSAPQ
jgi:chromosome segregation ATPase